MLGTETIINYPNNIACCEDHLNLSYRPVYFASLRGPLSQCLKAAVAYRLSLFMCAVSLLLLFEMWRRLDCESPVNSELAFCLTTVTCLLASPHLLDYDVLLLAVPAAIIFSSVCLSQQNKDRTRAFSVWSALIILYPLLSWVLWVLCQSMKLNVMAKVFQICFVNVVLAGCCGLMLKHRVSDEIVRSA